MIPNNALEPSLWSKTSWIQIGYGFWVNQIVVGIGLAMGFSSVAIPKLRDSDIKLSISDEAWLAGITNLTSPIGSISCGLIMDKFGRRFAMFLCTVPMTIGWFCTGFAETPVVMIVGRAITGIGVGMAATPARTYVTEISLPQMRGLIGAFPTLALSIGITTQAMMGTTFSCSTLSFISGSYMLFLTVLNTLLPETPYYQLMKSPDPAASLYNASQSLRKFRAKDYNCDLEIEDMKEFRNNNNIHRFCNFPLRINLVVEMRSQMRYKEQGNKATWWLWVLKHPSFILSCKEAVLALFQASSCKPFSIIAIFALFGQLSGVTVIMYWGVEMLQNSYSSLDPYIGNILLAVSRFIGGCLTLLLMYNIGRRPLALLSSVGVSIAAISVGLYIRYTTMPTIFPIIGYMIFIILGTVGFLALPPLMLFEMIPLQIRGLLGGITISMMFLFVFSANMCFPFVLNGIGQSNTVVAFGVAAILGTLYLYVFLPETKGLTLQEIEEFFNQRRPSLVSQRDVIASQLNVTHNK